MSDQPKIEARRIVIDKVAWERRPRVQPDPKLDRLQVKYHGLYPYNAPKQRLEGASWYDVEDDEPKGAA